MRGRFLPLRMKRCCIKNWVYVLSVIVYLSGNSGRFQIFNVVIIIVVHQFEGELLKLKLNCLRFSQFRLQFVTHAWLWLSLADDYYMLRFRIRQVFWYIKFITNKWTMQSLCLQRSLLKCYPQTCKKRVCMGERWLLNWKLLLLRYLWCLDSFFLNNFLIMIR